MGLQGGARETQYHVAETDSGIDVALYSKWSYMALLMVSILSLTVGFFRTFSRTVLLVAASGGSMILILCVLGDVHGMLAHPDHADRVAPYFIVVMSAAFAVNALMWLMFRQG
jgi:hypothetical protein